ncbi:MAG: ferritin [bacterium]|nr:ferritin [bacterium]
MLSETMQNAFNNQLNAEMFSSNLYLSMAAYLESINLPGFAHWMEIQAQEELGHALKIYKYINERRGRAWVRGVESPQGTWNSPLEVFEHALKHEQYVTASINKLVEMATLEKDTASQVFLHWFVNEQVEEEKNADSIVQQLKMIGSSVGALLVLDHHLGKREAAAE